MNKENANNSWWQERKTEAKIVAVLVPIVLIIVGAFVLFEYVSGPSNDVQWTIAWMTGAYWLFFGGIAIFQMAGFREKHSLIITALVGSAVFIGLTAVYLYLIQGLIGQ